MSIKKKSKTSHVELKKPSNIELTKPSYILSNDSTSDKLALFLIFISYFLYILWSMLSNATWDEDCPTRYFNTVEAFENPSSFIDLWNRPLFVILFAIPVQVGKIAIPLMMSFYASIAGWFLYKSARKLEMAFAPMVILFLLFQPYYMGVGRNAMTEPLASTLICVGFFLFLNKKWLWFALIGSLLPLARIELSVFLAIWAILLLLNNAWKFIPLLGLGLVLWSIGGFILHDDLFYVFRSISESEGTENRYGHQEVNTYLKRFFYIIGPVVFFYFIIGLTNKILNRSVDLFIFGQLLLGLVLYTLLAWKFNAGQSAGFLRNLIPLSPFIAIYALEGFRVWIDGVVFKKNRIILSIIMVASLLLIFAFYSNSLRFHHNITEKFDPFNFPFALGLFLVSCILLFIIFKKPYIQKLLIGLVSLSLISFTLLSEQPDSNMNPERYMINQISDDIKKLGLFDAPAIVSTHGWLFWTVDFNLKTKKIVRSMRKEQLNNLPNESVVIWDSHFSNKLGNNVELNDLIYNQNFVELANYNSTDLSKNGVVFLKRSKDKTESTLNEYIQKDGAIPILYMTRASYYYSQGNNNDKAKKDYETAIRLAPDVVQYKFKYVEYLINTAEYGTAQNMVNDLIKSDKELLVAYNLRGTLNFQQQNYSAALSDFEFLVKKYKTDGGAYYNVGLTYLAMNKKDEACFYFNRAKANNYNDAQRFIDQNCNQTRVK